MSKIPLFDGDLKIDYKTGNIKPFYSRLKNLQRSPTETDQEFGNRIHSLIKESLTMTQVKWIDGRYYEMALSHTQTLFGRISAGYTGWGEMRRQKKPPHTEVLYVWCLSTQKNESYLVLRSINNCSNNQLQDAIKLAALRLEERVLNQQDVEFLLDLCYAELQKRLNRQETGIEKRLERSQKP